MAYFGVLTPDSDDPSKFLKIPGLDAAKVLGYALLDQLGLYSSMKDALHTLTTTGNATDVLIGYCQLMRRCDIVRRSSENREEEHYRNSIWHTILKNPAIESMAEYQVQKVRSVRTSAYPHAPCTTIIAHMKLTGVVDG